MPGIFYQPQDRRAFLKFTATAGAALFMAGCRTPRTAGVTGKELHLALLSDTHTPGDRKNGHRAFNPWENLKAIVPKVMEARPEGIILCGDAARLEGKVEDYQELKALLEPAAACPIFIGMGNHDDRANFHKAFTQFPGERPMPDREVTVIQSESGRIIVLDSLIYPNKVTGGLLGKKQRDWLTKDLAAHPQEPTVLFVHHTLGDGDGDLLDANRLFEILKPHRQVKALFYGHSHVWSLGEREGIKLINLPAVGYNFRDQDPVGWVDARFNRGGVKLVMHALAGNKADDGREFEVKWKA